MSTDRRDIRGPATQERVDAAIEPLKARGGLPRPFRSDNPSDGRSGMDGKPIGPVYAPGQSVFVLEGARVLTSPVCGTLALSFPDEVSRVR